MFVRAGFSLLLLWVPAAALAMSGGSAATSARKAYDRQMRLLEHVFETHSTDEARLRSLYTRGAVLVEAAGNEQHGQDEIVRSFRKVLASGAVKHFRVRTTTFRTDGNLSYAGGTEDIDEVHGSGLRHTRNRFLLVMKHERDGTWRIDYVMEVRA